jgi:uncharacterized SAM-binding protein YcdF (DUF218 family)
VICANGQSESGYVRRLLHHHDVPDSAILVEAAATNTGENVRYSMPILDEQLGLSNVRSVIAVGKLAAARRYLMTIERWMPGRRLMSSPVSGHNWPKSRWDEHPALREAVLEEWGKIPDYLRRGFIAPVHLPQVLDDGSPHEENGFLPGLSPSFA